MSTGSKLAEVAALAGDPGRANMLSALMSGQALTASELAAVAGVAPPTASGHLAKLLAGGLVLAEAAGRRRYYRLASPEVARMLEAMMVVAGAETNSERRAVPRVPPALRDARTCYDHLAGRVAVRLAEALEQRGAVILSEAGSMLTDAGREQLAGLGVRLDFAAHSRRPICRPCLDWSERRPHVAGQLGAALLQHFLDKGWMRRSEAGRAVSVFPAGRRALVSAFGAALED